jgi:tetratricopeptide (TPR) repeat protein
MPGAVEDLKKALDLDPKCAAAFGWLGEADLRSPQAVSNLSRALELDPEEPWPRLYRGAALLLAGDLDSAARDFKGLLTLRPASGLGRLMLGLSERRRGSRRSAVRAFKAASAANGACSAAHLLRSRAEPSRRRSAEACEEALNADPTYAIIALIDARSRGNARSFLKRLRDRAFARPLDEDWYYHQGENHYAPSHLQEYEDASRLLRLRPRAAWTAALVGRGALRCASLASRLDIGARALERAVRRAPSRGWIYSWRALAKIQKHRLKEALADLDACVRLQPCYYRAYAWRGALLRKLGRPKKSLEDLDLAVALDERYSFAVHERSLTRRALGDLTGAVQDLERAFLLDHRYSWVFAVGREARPEAISLGLRQLDAAVASNPSSSSLSVWRGQLHLQRRDFSAAFRDFERVLCLDPWNALNRGWYGRGLLESGRAEEACDQLRQAVEHAPDVAIFRGWRAEAEFRRGRPKAAFSALKETLRRWPESWWAYDQRARFFLEQGRARAALNDAERALQIDGVHAEGHYLKACAHLRLSELRAADGSVERTLQMSPNMGKAYLLRARIRELQGKPDEAVRDYRTVYDRFPYLLNDEQKRSMSGLLEGVLRRP